MKSSRLLVAVAVLAIGAQSVVTSTASAQVARALPSAATIVDTDAHQVQYRRHYHHHRGYRGDAGAAVAGGIIGLAAGAMIAGAAANAAAQQRPAADPNWIAYCSRKYRSFDPNSGTYLAHDGNRYYCQ